MEEKTIKCNNCKQEISESKITLHEAFCLRNNKYCEKCNQVILISQYDEHIKSHENKKKEEPKKIIKEEKIINNIILEDENIPLGNYDNFKKIDVEAALKKKKEEDERKKKEEEKKKAEEERIRKKKEEIAKKVESMPMPKIKAIKIDDSLGLKKCEYCNNMIENIKEHYNKCEAKKFLEEEELQYKNNIKKLIEEDMKLAKKIYSTQKPIMDTRKDTEIAKKIQKELKPIIDTKKDKEIAKK